MRQGSVVVDGASTKLHLLGQEGGNHPNVQALVDHPDRIRVYNLNILDWLEIRGARGEVLGVYEGLVGELDIFRGEFVPVVEAHATAEIEQNDRVVFCDWQNLREPRTNALKRHWIGQPQVLFIREVL